MPIPKLNQPQQRSDYRPISVTSVQSGIVEKFIVLKFMIPALPVHDRHHQSPCKPSGSTTSALIAINHCVTHMLEIHSYVRYVLLDFSKSFDTIDHPFFESFNN
jgi:Reverse transcriptase (RNA-dependent DNA polymerase)